MISNVLKCCELDIFNSIAKLNRVHCHNAYKKFMTIFVLVKLNYTPNKNIIS